MRGTAVRWLYFLSVFIHILSAIIWLGGMLFLILIVVPVTRQEMFRALSTRLIHWTGVRFRTIGWICLLLLIITGSFNIFYRGYGWPDIWNGNLWKEYFGEILAIKLFLVGSILVLSALHDFYIGPRATELMQQNPDLKQAETFRKIASLIGRINLILGLVVVFLGIMLVRGWPW